MEARTTAALAAVVRDANTAAVAENARLRQALRRARFAVQQGDRALALRYLAEALGEAEPPPRTARGQHCAMCGHRARTVFQQEPTGRWQGVTPERRRLCRACNSMQPPAP